MNKQIPPLPSTQTYYQENENKEKPKICRRKKIMRITFKICEIKSSEQMKLSTNEKLNI
jgi:hypothetical protein